MMESTMFVALMKYSSFVLLFWCFAFVNANFHNTSLSFGENGFAPAQCNMLPASKFSLDLGCILNKDKHGSHQLIAPKLHDCKKVCCDFSEGPCDLVYWSRYQKCIIMSYHMLGVCPLLAVSDQPAASAYTLLFSISKRVSLDLRKKLLSQGYRYEIQKLLGCNSDKFVCDNWDCVSERLVCDGKQDCTDASDERGCPKRIAGPQPQCIDSNGKYVGVGSQYVPFDDADNCKMCICGNNSQPFGCYSATCYNSPRKDCNGLERNICCHCHSVQPGLSTPPQDSPFVNLSDTQRLIVSCMSVLVVITLLLFLSRNILHRGRRPMQQGHGYFSRAPIPDHRMSHASGLTGGRSFVGRYWRERESVSFFDGDGLGASYGDLPPTYDELKPPEHTIVVSLTDSDGSLGPPPSYSSETSRPMQNVAPYDDEDIPAPAESTDPHPALESPTPSPMNESSECNPVSPLSTTSESPLL